MAFGGIKVAEPLVFEITSGAGVKVLALSGNRIGIGRSRDNDIVLDDPQVSRHHSRLDRLETNGWRVSDLTSRNGTFVNGIRVSGRPMAYRVGDELAIGTSTIRICQTGPKPGESETILTVAAGASRLSPRETSVLRLVAEGCTDAEIATRLMISIKTVHSHLDKIRDKTGARRRPELIRAAMQRGLV